MLLLNLALRYLNDTEDDGKKIEVKKKHTHPHVSKSGQFLSIARRPLYTSCNLTGISFLGS